MKEVIEEFIRMIDAATGILPCSAVKNDELLSITAGANGYLSIDFPNGVHAYRLDKSDKTILRTEVVIDAGKN